MKLKRKGKANPKPKPISKKIGLLGKDPRPFPKQIISVERYVPLYSRRSDQNHEEIRQRIKFDPKTCRHLKGMGRGPSSMITDYNISHYLFIDGRERVRCMNCRRDWFRGTPEWVEAKAMLEHTSNTLNSSERPGYQVREKKDGPIIFFHTREEIRLRYPDWDGKVQNLIAQRS